MIETNVIVFSLSFSILGGFFDPEPQLDSLLKDMNAFEDGPDTALPNHDNAPPTESLFPVSPILVTTAIHEHPPTPPPASTKPQVPVMKRAALNMKVYCVY